MIPLDEDLVLHRGTRNSLLPSDHWLRAFDGHTSRRDGLETSFVAMIPLYRRVIETQDICMLTRDRFDDKRTRRHTEYHSQDCYSFYSTKACVCRHFYTISSGTCFRKNFVLFFIKYIFWNTREKGFLVKNNIIELHLFESVRYITTYLHMSNCSRDNFTKYFL